ncbi:MULTISPECIES: universal stress protein [unclassified Tenacibaculum]|uniref:universal stress protein n=1 Tax=unclassified Tenacibaculum TaxID=2635139 RepID=UPI001F35A044|nr:MULTISPECIES: universal stress protein [unclassified Tenacibaculum]MCF2874735.1 universal stress protein [Tenacibaculum sp. Cn5-1]MCF2934199.1 universal stress protein [Tenacibaculum sp. Cn5-34]MCG7510409.1 universal stress protein [Tenacibaculum sp. Cn5-46]
MKHILVPIGSSDNSINTLQYAINFAEAMNAKVLVMRAYKILSKAGAFVNADDTMQRETNLYLRTMINSVDRKNVDIKMITAKGNVLESITSINRELNIDLIIMGPKSNSIKEEVFLGNTSGSVLKQTDIPMLIVPENYAFSPIKKVLTTFKSGIINKDGVLTPLQKVLTAFSATSNLLLVKTPSYTDNDLKLDSGLEAIKSELTITENATTFQGVLEHFQSHNPDLLCVFRRNRGFFQKLWESNTILKKEFHCNVPVLVLRGKL